MRGIFDVGKGERKNNKRIKNNGEVMREERKQERQREREREEEARESMRRERRRGKVEARRIGIEVLKDLTHKQWPGPSRSLANMWSVYWGK